MDESDIQESKEIRERLKRLTHIALDIQKEAESHYKDLESNQSGLDKSMVLDGLPANLPNTSQLEYYLVRKCKVTWNVANFGRTQGEIKPAITTHNKY
ncbi:hypothetical protein CWI39_0133p0030 [Hamiltosporidium magnivora]|uniref:Uncharacterized protein n=1 Tax=Hamiltosporidium magnivora TaxID=148818 RepID=A0A4Q9LLB5_9MICR|nr:hypothetical protein CWI39_0133p0030 [Hamiltosporidium magnivora]